MKALIFGGDGQDGYYLRAACASAGMAVEGLALSEANGCRVGNVADFALVEALVRELQPDILFHLAAFSSTRHEALFENHAAITTGALNVLEAVRRHCPACRVFITGSGVQFVNRGRPIKESDPFDPSSAYAVSRIESVYWARYYRRLGVKAYVGYLFHHESPLRKPDHLCKLIAEAAKRAARGSAERLRLMDISVRKEAGFAGDIMAGALALVSQDRVFEATIGTGEAHSIQEWLTVCFGKLGLDWRAHVTVDPGGGQAEYQSLVSDPSTIRSLGWEPQVGFEALAEMMLA